jgi:hypothetical protein
MIFLYAPRYFSGAGFAILPVLEPGHDYWVFFYLLPGIFFPFSQKQKVFSCSQGV